MITLIEKFYRWLILIGKSLRSPFLLVVRLFWGWQFFIAGKGKLGNLEKTTQFFDSLHIPAAHLNAIVASSIECFGGLLLLVGFASRLVSIPLMAVMTVAYLTADIESLKGIFSAPDKFTGSDEFLFLFAAVIIFVFGPGLFSVDGVIGKYFKRDGSQTASR